MPDSQDQLEILRSVRDKLSQQFLSHPGISLIDIGYDPERHHPSGQPVVRIHLRDPSIRQELNIPAEMDGVTIRILSGDYKLE